MNRLSVFCIFCIVVVVLYILKKKWFDKRFGQKNVPPVMNIHELNADVVNFANVQNEIPATTYDFAHVVRGRLPRTEEFQIQQPRRTKYEQGCEFMRGPRADGRAAFAFLQEAIEEERNPEAVLMIAELYRVGIHNSVNPDKITACRIYQTIQDYSSKFPRHITVTARQRHTETMDTLMRNEVDTDVVTGGGATMLLSRDFPFELARTLARFDDVSVAMRWRRNEALPERVLTDELHGHAINTNVNRILPPGQDIDLEDPRVQELLFPNQRPVGIQPADIRQIAQVQVRVNNDSQNVHSTTVLNCAKKVLDSQKLDEVVSFETARDFVLSATAKTKCDVNKIQRVLTAMNNEKHSRFDKSEIEILREVVTRIQKEKNITKKNNLAEILAHQLESAVEPRAGVVCSTGRIVRILSVYDGVDDSQQKIVPEWALDQEIANLAIRIRESVLKAASEEDVADYNSARSTKLADEMNKRFEAEARTSYGTIVSRDVLQKKLDVYREGF
jgi:hypothetical protein